MELPLTPYFFFSPLPKPIDYLTWDSYKAAVDRRSDFVVIGDKLESSKNRLSYLIASQMLEEMVPLILSQSTTFTISHPDLHSGNIFVDDELNITCIIDWGSATTGPMTELLATPGLGGPSKPPASCLTASFQSGFREIRDFRQDILVKSEMMWYYSRLVRIMSGQDLYLFSVLYELIYKSGTENSTNYGGLFHSRALLASNERLMASLREEDLPDEDVRELEKAVFSSARTDRLAVARKLTLMSEMNPGFIGDRRLWRWLEDALES